MANVAALDSRLTATTTPEVLRQIITDHDCSAEICAECGYRTTRKQPVCRSVVTAKAALWCRRPSWKGEALPTPRTEPATREQLELFGVPDQIELFPVRPGEGQS